MERYVMPGGKGWQIFPDLRKLCHDENIFVSLVFIRSLPNMCLLFPLFSSAWSKSYPLLSLSSFSTFHMIFNGPCWCSGGVPLGFGSVLCYNLNVKVIVYLQTYMSCDCNIVTAPSINTFDNISIKTLLRALITLQLSITLSSLTQCLEIKEGSQIPNHPQPVSSPGPKAVLLFVLTYHGVWLFYLGCKDEK